MEHGLTTIFITLEIFITAHRYGRIVVDLGIVLAYASTYLAWNMIGHSIDEVFPYAFQSKIAAKPFVAVLVYMALGATFALIFFLVRFVSQRIWRTRMLGAQVSEAEDEFASQQRALVEHRV